MICLLLKAGLVKFKVQKKFCPAGLRPAQIEMYWTTDPMLRFVRKLGVASLKQKQRSSTRNSRNIMAPLVKQGRVHAAA